MTKRRMTVGVFTAMVAVLATAGIAWACLYNSSISLSSDHGASGTTVMVTGTGFAAGSVAAVYWDSQQSPPLASVPVQGSTVEIPITIPAATEEVHTVLAVATVGGRPYLSRQAFEVMPASDALPGAADQARAGVVSAPSAPVASHSTAGTNWVLIGLGLGLVYLVAGGVTAMALQIRSRRRRPSPPLAPPLR